MSTDVAGLVAPRISKGKNIFLWLLQLIGAAVFFMSGFMKLSGNEQMVQMFDLIGMGQWFAMRRVSSNSRRRFSF